MEKITKEQIDLVIRLFVAREEQRACDMQRYGANVYAPIDREDIIIELFGEEYIDKEEKDRKEKEKEKGIVEIMESGIPF